MRSRLPDGAVFVGLLGGLILLGLLSLRLIPVYEPLWGLDFQNVYAFQTCAEAAELGPYAVSGAECGDVRGRAFNYPPAMFHAFFWVDSFSYHAAVITWNVAMIVIILGTGIIWWIADRSKLPRWQWVALLAVWVALLSQYPFVFALERGNNDVLPLLFWSLAMIAFIKERPGLSGAMAGFAIGLKIYPAVAVAVVAPGLFRSRRTEAPRFALGLLVGLLLTVAIWWEQVVDYVTITLPDFISVYWVPMIFNHPILGLQLPTALVAMVAVGLFGVWFIASWRGFDQAPPLVFAGALAISTYFSNTSWDYNLITTFPLILLGTARALRSDQRDLWKIGVFASILTVIAGRGLFSAQTQTLAQVASLALLALLTIQEPPAESKHPAPTSRPRPGQTH